MHHALQVGECAGCCLVKLLCMLLCSMAARDSPSPSVCQIFTVLSDEQVTSRSSVQQQVIDPVYMALRTWLGMTVCQQPHST